MYARAVMLALLCALQTRRPEPRRAPALTPPLALVPARPAPGAPSKLAMCHAIASRQPETNQGRFERWVFVTQLVLFTSLC